MARGRSTSGPPGTSRRTAPSPSKGAFAAPVGATPARTSPSPRASAMEVELALTAYWMSKAAPSGPLPTPWSLVSGTESTSTMPSCVAAFMKPGVTVAPRASITRAPAGGARPAPIASMRPSRMMRVVSGPAAVATPAGTSACTTASVSPPAATAAPAANAAHARTAPANAARTEPNRASPLPG